MGVTLDKPRLLIAGILLPVVLAPPAAWSHGFAGKRFFPSTLATDDPFVSDEFSLLGSHIREPGGETEPATVSTELSADYTKRITPHFGISLGGSYRHLEPDGGGNRDGFGNLELGAKYQFLTSEAHEAIMSIGFGAEAGGTGDARVGADPFSTLSPALFFGKGMGDLPETAKYLRPLAITGQLGVNVPTSAKTVTIADDGGIATELHPVTLKWGFALAYNLQYLQSFVEDVGLKEPVSRMIPLVELAMDTCVNRGCEGKTVATANPGFIWFGRHVQLGVEAQIPLNERTGDNLGVLTQLHFFIDDLFPDTLGRPFSGGAAPGPAW